MGHFVQIRRVGAEKPGWQQCVSWVPTVGTLLTFGCTRGEHLFEQRETSIAPDEEGNILTSCGPWRVEAIVQHLLCSTQAEIAPEHAMTIEIVVVPVLPHQRTLVDRTV